MSQSRRRVFVGALLSVGMTTIGVGGQESAGGPKCTSIRAEMVEDFSTVGCNPPRTTCFLGEVDGNHGFHGTTHFQGDSGAAGPPLSPGFRSYSGLFEYRTTRGTLFTRETGVVNTTTGNPESGAVTAYQQILDANGELTGVTGYFFVSGFSRDNHVDTQVIGELCFP
jgi:hypothetical protein